MKSNMQNGLFGSAIRLLAMGFIVSATFISCQDTTVTSLADDNSVLKPVAFAKGGNGNGNSANVPDNLTPNSQRYNDSSMPAASGRDGEVVVTARALINSAGVTDLEVTTGSLDTDETAPGTLTKLLVKALDSGTPDIDNPVWEQNYNRLNDGGYFTTSYDNLAHGQPIYVHSNVRGIIRGMAVVKITEEVKFRPDLSVLNIDAPSEVYVGDPVLINAEITEGLGDLGATSDCVMYIDGTEVDRADGIWVDAGDAVVCAFSTQFNELGTREVKIAAENVVPGDYDTSNNSATTQIEVIEPSVNDFYWWGHTYIDVTSNYYSYLRQYTRIHGWKKGNTGFPMDISVQVSSGGNKWLDESISGANANSTWWGSAYYETSLPYNSFLRIYEYDRNSYSYTWVHFDRYARNVVYYGTSYYGGSYYSYYQYNDTMLPYGTDVSFDIQLNGSTNNARLNGVIQLREYNYKNRHYLRGYSYGYPD